MGADRWGWQGFAPPQYLYSKREFLGIALDPPNFEPGSWIGAGKAIYDPEGKRILLTARPRKVEGDVRGYAAQIYGSKNGRDFQLIGEVTKEEVTALAGMKIHSIEGTQLLRDPLTGEWHLYVSVDTGEDFVWGGIKWETLLLSAAEIQGPWNALGIVLANDQIYDACQARDATIDIVDGTWICLYKGKNEKREERPALAISGDGKIWEKRGTLTIDGQDRLGFLSGTLFAASAGTLFVGMETQLADSRSKKDDVVYADSHGIGHGGGSTPHFAAYRLNIRERNLETVFKALWTPLSPYEHSEHPLLGYSSLVYDPVNNRMLIYVEAIDPKLSRAIGLNETVERLLVYQVPDLG